MNLTCFLINRELFQRLIRKNSLVDHAMKSQYFVRSLSNLDENGEGATFLFSFA